MKEFMKFYKGLTPDLLPHKSAYEKLHSILPKLPDYLKKLSEDNSMLLEIMVDRMRGACEYAYTRGDWDGFISLLLQGAINSDHGDYGLTYVRKNRQFHESVKWILTRESVFEEKKEIILIDSAKLYDNWSDVIEENPVEQFKTVDEILEYGENLNEKSYLVLPKVRIKGLSISKNGIEETAFNIQKNFYNDSLLVSRLPRSFWYK